MCISGRGKWRSGQVRLPVRGPAATRCAALLVPATARCEYTHVIMRFIVILSVLVSIAAAQVPQYDLVLKGGHVIDAKNHIDDRYVEEELSAFGAVCENGFSQL